MSRRSLRSLALPIALALLPLAGCGTTKTHSATEQLLLSNAVDRTVASMDFSALADQKVYLDTEYVMRVRTPVANVHAPGAGFVNSDYIISSVRQQMAAAGCLLQDKKEDADYIAEIRIGTLGSDAHEVTYGVPANNLLSAAASIVPGSPSLPTIPEISVAKRNDQLAAAKIGVFAYDRVTREGVWQSGLSEARSTARATWVLGAGPFQRGSIYQGTRFAGAKLSLPIVGSPRESNPTGMEDYYRETHFVPVGAEEEAAVDGKMNDTVTPASGTEHRGAEAAVNAQGASS